MHCQVCKFPFAPHELRAGYCLRCLPSTVSTSVDSDLDLNAVRAYEEMFHRFIRTQKDRPDLGIGDPRFRPSTQGLPPQEVARIELRVFSTLELPADWDSA